MIDIDIKEVLLQWFRHFFIKSLLHLKIDLVKVVVLNLLLNKINN